MGWLYSSRHRSYTALHASVTEEQGSMKCIAKCAKGFNRRLWTVWESKHPDSLGKRLIVLFLCNRYKEDGQWWYGYKDISEDMGPCEKDCPLSYLDKATPSLANNQWSKDWRQAVTEYHAKRKRAFTVGDRVTVYGKAYTVYGKRARSWVIVADNGMRYRSSADKMELATI